MSIGGKTVLLVEDNEDNRIVYSTILQHFGYVVMEALNGEEGIAKARAERPDLILMDISIPVIDGWEATQVLKRDPETRGIPIIALTAHALASDREKAMEVGCDSYLAKPCEPKAVVSEVEKFIGKGNGALSRQKPLVLIVDDHPDNVEVLQARLNALGYRTARGVGRRDSAQDGRGIAARSDLARRDDAATWTATKSRGASRQTSRCRTSRSSCRRRSTRRRARSSGSDSGADDYVTKPINYAELQARMGAALRVKALQDQCAKNGLAEMAITDALTGVYNRRHLDERLDEMFEHSARLHESLSVVDVRHRSLQEGERHVRPSGRAMWCSRSSRSCSSSAARDIDRIGRYGGEEFMVLLPGTVLDAGVTFAKRVRQEVEAHQFEYEGGVLQCTVSAGVAACPHPRIHSAAAAREGRRRCALRRQERRTKPVVRFDDEKFNVNVKDVDDQHAHGAVEGGAARPG